MLEPMFIQLEPMSDMCLLLCSLPDFSDIEAAHNTNSDLSDFASVLQNVISLMQSDMMLGNKSSASL